MTDPQPFWRTKTLSQMTRPEWESLCDGCGRCCLHKIRDEDTEALHWTEVACRLLDTNSCRCSDYPNRRDKVPDCVRLTARRVQKLDWLPPTCAYRLIEDGRDLPRWHPLVTGRAESVHEAGISVRGRVVSERVAGALEDHVVDWPGRWPTGTRRPVARPAVPPPGAQPLKDTAGAQPLKDTAAAQPPTDTPGRSPPATPGGRRSPSTKDSSP